MGVVINNFLGVTSKEISVKHGIPIITVETVIKGYLESLIASAEQGERIVIDGVTSISVVKGLVGDNDLVKRSLSSRVRSIAYKNGIHLKTVELLLKDYLASLIALAKNGKTIEINGMTTITIVKDTKSDDFSIRGRIAPALKSRLEALSSGDYLLRGRVSPVLKAELQRTDSRDLVLS
jgi:nucleoid DNA-binding protein